MVEALAKSGARTLPTTPPPTPTEGKEQEDILDIHFDFQSLNPIDYHGIKTLLTQTFPLSDPSAAHIHASLGPLAENLIAQSYLGSTVKVDDDGNSDPYALCTILPCHATSARPIVDYLLAKGPSSSSSSSVPFNAIASRLTLSGNASARTAFLFNERLINMPPQIAPPLLRMLGEELEWAQEDGKLSAPMDYFVIVSKLYHEVESTVDAEMAQEEEGGMSKPAKKRAKKSKNEAFHYQIEDTIFEKYAEACFDYKLPISTSSDARRVFQECGIEPFRRVMLVPASTFPHILKEVESALQ